jgi:ABC-type lipoprotein release transport system permease subunit
MKCGIAILVTPVRTGSMFEQNARGVQGSYHGGRTPVLIGVIAALILMQLMRTMLVGVKPTDPLTLGATMLLYFAIATASSWIPANRAAGVDPNQALREE